MRTVSICALGLLAMAAAATVAAEEPPHVRAELVSDADRLEPGSTVNVAVRLVMDEGWHVYWTNPGDAGLATEVTWQAPDGLEVRELPWPVPDSFDSPGGIASYGYGGEVVLPYSLEVGMEPDDPAPIRATVGWLACREKCVLGEATVESTLPVPASDAARGRELIDAALAAAPRPGGEATFDLRSVTRVPEGERSGSLVAWVSWPEPPTGEVVWYPDAASGLKVEGVTARTRSQLTRIDARVTVMNDDAPEAVPSVLVVKRPDGQRTGWRIDVPVRETTN
jgi:DsbC/DsbD-like thiol-disulfide interchange protein